MPRLPSAACAMALAATLVACASAPPAPPAPPLVPFVYTAAPSPLQYELSDTLVFEAQMARTEVASSGVVELTATPDSSRIRLAIRFVDFAGRFTNAVSGASTDADERAIAGPFRMLVTPRGEIVEIGRPTMTPEFQQVSRSGDILRSLVLRVPASGITRGTSWTDTVRVSETEEGMTSVNQSIITSSWTRDTTVAGQTLHVIESTAQNTVTLSGNTPAGDMRQHLTGTTHATSLWSSERGLLVSRASRGELTGTLEVPQMGSIPVRARVRTSVTLR